MKITVLIGNPKAGSRTLTIAERLTELMFDRDSIETTIVDLAEYASEIFTWPSDSMSELSRIVAESELLIVGSPTYKGSYTGLLKGFLDRYPADGLAGVVAIPLMTGADLGHSMGPEVNLRPLLVELGASLPSKALYFVMSEYDRLDEVLEHWITVNAAAISAVSEVAGALAVAELTETAK